jgi:hypothetical protein
MTFVVFWWRTGICDGYIFESLFLPHTTQPTISPECHYYSLFQQKWPQSIHGLESTVPSTSKIGSDWSETWQSARLIWVSTPFPLSSRAKHFDLFFITMYA